MAARRRRRRRRLRARLRERASQLLAFLFSNVGVVVLVFAYTVAGAFMFQAIEGAREIERANNMSRERDNMAQHLWQNVTLTLNLFNETALKERISSELAGYQRRVVRAVRRGWDGGRSSRQWGFSSAFLYSLTVITTIGYGHLSPRTFWGKILTIIYALLGMPLFLLYLTNVGELLARWFKCLYALVCLCRGCPGYSRRVPREPESLEESEASSIERPASWAARPAPPALAGCAGYPGRPAAHALSAPPALHAPPAGWSERAAHAPLRAYSPYEDEWRGASGAGGAARAAPVVVPLSVCVAVLVGYIIFGSMIFGLWEQWDQLDGAYFCFISLSSIGFGDIVPGERVFAPRVDASFVVCSLYLMLGMAVVAMCFNLMQEQVIHYFAAMKRALRRACRCKR